MGNEEPRAKTASGPGKYVFLSRSVGIFLGHERIEGKREERGGSKARFHLYDGRGYPGRQAPLAGILTL
jgi:hypothetical protein